MESNRVAVGLSGGVDSAVTALLLKQEGYEVEGIFMKNWDEDDDTEYCTAIQDFDDAQQVADKLDIPLHPINFAAEYWDSVFEDFLSEYAAGRTPNPDVLCNRNIKFAVFQDYAEMRGAQLIATGHYARLNRDTEPIELHRADDLDKDQTYFLQAVPRQRFERCIFPLANLSKNEVRATAKRYSLHVYGKKDSTGICFIGERRFDDFLNRYLPRDPGPIIDTDGVVVGEHSGLAYYTLGQRQGLRIGGMRDAAEAPWYVKSKQIETNELVVTQDQAQLQASCLLAEEPNWFVEDPTKIVRCEAIVRYRSVPKPCTIETDGTGVKVFFDEPQRAITPGQYVAFYSGTRCLGGAKIKTVVDK
ncbi:MAG: tRNA 2-thiouridine(34) synthase MnmA [Gammaproteobacteria bacterium]|nr:tRNA 2-thiouridine(34) synthase MnmA [Gammaproteobacteria bacterium]